MTWLCRWGSAGLAGAVVLGRALRSVLVIDGNAPRNGPAAGIHNYLTREALPPLQFLAAGRAEAEQHGVTFRSGTVSSVTGGAPEFQVELRVALLWRSWSDDVVLLLNDAVDLNPMQQLLDARGVRILPGQVQSFTDEGVRLADGTVLPRDNLAVHTRVEARAVFLEPLSLKLVDHGARQRPAGRGPHGSHVRTRAVGGGQRQHTGTGRAPAVAAMPGARSRTVHSADGNGPYPGEAGS